MDQLSAKARQSFSLTFVRIPSLPRWQRMAFIVTVTREAPEAAIGKDFGDDVGQRSVTEAAAVRRRGDGTGSATKSDHLLLSSDNDASDRPNYGRQRHRERAPKKSRPRFRRRANESTPNPSGCSLHLRTCRGYFIERSAAPNFTFTLTAKTSTSCSARPKSRMSPTGNSVVRSIDPSSKQTWLYARFSVVEALMLRVAPMLTQTRLVSGSRAERSKAF